VATTGQRVGYVRVSALDEPAGAWVPPGAESLQRLRRQVCDCSPRPTGSWWRRPASRPRPSCGRPRLGGGSPVSVAGRSALRGGRAARCPRPTRPWARRLLLWVRAAGAGRQRRGWPARRGAVDRPTPAGGGRGGPTGRRCGRSRASRRAARSSRPRSRHRCAGRGR